MSTVWLGLGSNLGDRRAHLKRAELSLGSILSDIAAAPCYESSPVDYLDQPDFLNTVLRGRTDLAPADLLRALLALEAAAGRTRGPGAHPKGPRIIDIDILLYDSLVLNSPSALKSPESSEFSEFSESPESAKSSKSPESSEFSKSPESSEFSKSPESSEFSKSPESSDKTGQQGSLIIPHPRMAQRLFVLKPLLDLDPDIIDPADGVMWAHKASSLSSQNVKLYRE